MLASRCLTRVTTTKFGSNVRSRMQSAAKTTRNFTTKIPKKALLMDANGIIYKRNVKKMEALSQFLASTGRYLHEKLDSTFLALYADSLANVGVEANKGIVTSDQYYMTLLSVLPINPVDYAGALNAIRESENNISLFPDVQEVLTHLKQDHGVKLAIITDSKSTTPQKKQWMQKAGLNTDLFDVIVNSSDIGVTKPDPRMYTTALDKLGLAPSDAVFLGHKRTELLGAKALGCSTVVMFPDADLLENGMKELANFDYYIPAWKYLPKVPLWSGSL